MIDWPKIVLCSDLPYLAAAPVGAVMNDYIIRTSKKKPSPPSADGGT